MQSVMNHTFSMVPEAEIQRSSFNRSFAHKTTFDAGYLVPIMWDEVLPGDTFHVEGTLFARLGSPLKYPIMDNLVLDSFFFFVPLRLVWSNFVKMMGEQANPADSVDFHVPQMTGPGGAGIAVGSLSDYFGLPTGIANLTFNSLLHRSYSLVWNTWFRDENIQNSVVVDTDDGPDTYTDYVLKKRGKRHDYFTSCLPWPQKATDVVLPLGSTAPVIVSSGSNNQVVLRDSGTKAAILNAASGTFNTGAGGGWNVGGSAVQLDPNSSLVTDLSTATAATINALRTAFQIQRLYERDARGGTRYCEIIQSHFGVTDPMNAVLQRPVYLGGGSSDVVIHPVPATNQAATVNLGSLASFGTVAGSGHGFTKSFSEHGIILGLVSVRADLTYQQGLHKAFTRRGRFDFYWPALGNLGEQAVTRGEIYCDGTANDNIVFGYQERFAEYRYKPSMITGKFRSTYATPLDAWHLSQKFTGAPALDSTFIEETPPMDRVLAVNTEPHFICDSFFNMVCARPMATYAVPGMIDHF